MWRKRHNTANGACTNMPESYFSRLRRSQIGHHRHVAGAYGTTQEMPLYVDTFRMFKRGEKIALCEEALRSGPKTTKELASHVMQAKGLDAGDAILVRSEANQLLHFLRMQLLRGKLICSGSKKGRASIWRLPDTSLA